MAGITFRIGPYRRKKEETKAEWILSPAKQARLERLFLEAYSAPPEPSISLLKCQHGVYLGDQHDGYCTVCTDYRVSGLPGLGRSEKRLRGQTSLSKPFPRKGFVNWRSQVLPPLDQRLKMRTIEALGGYVRKGIAIKAEKGYGEGFTRITVNRLPLSQATMPNPVRGFRGWTYPDDERFFRYVAVYRSHFHTVPPPAYEYQGCTITYFGRQDSGGLRLRSEQLPQARKRSVKKGESNHRTECSELSAIDWKSWRPPDYQPTEKDIQLWQRKYWSTRAHYDPTEGKREPLNLMEETRTDRETDGRLKIKWGGRWRPKEMHERVWKRLHSARSRLAATGTGPYCWPSDNTPRGHSENYPSQKREDFRIP